MASRYLLESSATDGYLLEDGSGVLLLEGLDARPNLLMDFPNPRGPQRSVDLVTWSKNLLQNTLKPIDGRPRAPLFTRLEPPVYPVSLRTWDQGNLRALRDVQAAPSKPMEWANPRTATPAINLRTWTQNTTRLIGKDTLPSLQRDWPNPRGATPVYPSWVDKTRIQLIGKDTLPFPNRDWPNPLVPIPAVDLKIWTDNLTRLIGKDLLPQQNYDWTNPSGTAYPMSLRGWTNAGITEVFSYILRSPLFTRLGPLHQPLVDLYQNLLLTTLGTAQNPFAPIDWPNPRGYSALIPSWADSTRIQLIGKDALPFLNRDWPNPRGPHHPLHPSIASLLGTLLRVPQSPFYQTDWPNPWGDEWPVELRSWIDAVRIELIGKDQLPFDQMNWPVPLGKIPASVLATWVNQLQRQLIGKDTLPFNQDNWPVPWSIPPNQWPPLNPFNPNLPPTPPSADQLRQRIRFAPLAFGGRTHWTR